MKYIRLAAAFSVAALALSACSAEISNESGQSTSGAGRTDTLTTGEPVILGAQAPLKGASAYPQAGFGLKAAVYYVNEVLGGINGRPIELDLCEGDGSPETSINCANGFVSRGVPLVIDTVDQSMGAAVPILGSANIPIVGTLAGSFVADSAPYGKAFYFTGPIAFGALSTVTAIHSMGKKSASLAVNESPTSHTYVDTLIKPIAKNLGISIDVQYPPAAGANLTVVAATQISDNPDVAGVISITEDSCTSLFQALRKQGYDGTIVAGACSQFTSEMGAAAQGIVMQPRLWLPLTRDAAPATVQEQLGAFEKAMNAVGYGKELSSRSINAFASVVNIAQILSDAGGEVTAAAVTEAFKGVKDFPTFAGPTVTCDGQQWPGVATTCNAQAIFLEVQQDGKLHPINEGGYVDLDLSIMPASS